MSKPRPNTMTYVRVVSVPLEILVTMDMSTEEVLGVEFERISPLEELKDYAERNPEAFSPWIEG